MLFTVPSRYSFTIGHLRVFSLSGWCRQIQTGFLRPRPTQDTDLAIKLTCTGLSPPMVPFSKQIPLRLITIISVLQPQSGNNHFGLGSSAFARHYLRNHYCFLLLRVLRCFSSPGSLLLLGDMSSTCRVAPFGNLRINSYVHFPAAYRSLSRPSSPLRA